MSLCKVIKKQILRTRFFERKNWSSTSCWELRPTLFDAGRERIEDTSEYYSRANGKSELIVLERVRLCHWFALPVSDTIFIKGQVG